jgi:hypothetical protein
VSEIIVVTTFQREELLFLSLEAIRREDSEIRIAVASDRGQTSDDLNHICDLFRAELTVAGDSHSYGNSFNLMTALRCALNGTFAVDLEHLRIVHCIEDDTILHPGYFSWARQQLAQTVDFSIASQFKDMPIGMRSHALYAAVCGRIGSPHIPNWYESPCASWNADYLRIALNHLIPEYFAPTREEMQRMLDEKMFPNSKYKKGGAEQDGFFLRCIEHHKWQTKFPPKPLATHLGWYGYNSPPARERPTGNLEQRVEQCRAMLRDAEKRKFLFGHRITDAEISGMNGL